MKGVSTLLNEFAALIPRALLAMTIFGLCWYALRVGPRVMTTAVADTDDAHMAASYRWSGPIVYLLAVILPSCALLGVNTVGPSFWTVALVALVAIAYQYRSPARELLAGIQLQLQQTKGKRVRMKGEEYTIATIGLLRCQLQDDKGQQARPNSEVLAALGKDGE